jgi:hypothetical protein
MKYIALPTLLDQARALGIAKGKTFIIDSEDEMTLALDLAMYGPRRTRSCAIERYRNAAKLPPESDDARVLDAMCRSAFSIWRIERRHDLAGLILLDLLRETTCWLIDLGLEGVAKDGMCFAARLSTPEQFSMTSGVSVPVDRLTLESAFDRLPALDARHGEAIAGSPQFARAIYRAAIEGGVMQRTHFV